MPEFEESTDAQLDRERTEEAHALFSALAALAGLREFPRVNPDTPAVPVPNLDDSVAALQEVRHLPRPLRLELLARLVNAPDPSFDPINLDGIARTLVHPSLEEDNVSVAATLTKSLKGWKEGTEPLGRTSLADLESPPDGHVSLALHADIQCTMLTFDVGCGAQEVSVDGIEAMSIVTDMHTCKPFDLFEPVINPLKWPTCWLESQFFKSMVPVPTLPKGPTPQPDSNQGWRQTVLETVDFGFAIAPDGTQELQTQLDFLFFWNGAPNPTLGATPHGVPGSSTPNVAFSAPAALTGVATPPGTGAALPVVTRSQVPAAGCTYDLRSSYDNRILVDQGFLLVEEIPGHDFRRYRTQKEVRFAAANPPANVCRFWSLATGMIMQGC